MVFIVVGSIASEKSMVSFAFVAIPDASRSGTVRATVGGVVSGSGAGVGQPARTSAATALRRKAIFMGLPLGSRESRHGARQHWIARHSRLESPPDERSIQAFTCVLPSGPSFLSGVSIA